MRWKTLFKIAVGLIILFAIAVSIINTNHPIVLKWLSGTARIIGKPVKATVYTDGTINNGIKVYSVDTYLDSKKTHYYLLSLKEHDKDGMLKYINIDLKENWVGRPVGANDDCYDVINGYLFQGETGGLFVDFKNDMKGFNFDPCLTYKRKQIKFNVPPNWLKFGSVTIDLN